MVIIQIEFVPPQAQNRISLQSGEFEENEEFIVMAFVNALNFVVLLDYVILEFVFVFQFSHFFALDFLAFCVDVGEPEVCDLFVLLDVLDLEEALFEVLVVEVVEFVVVWVKDLTKIVKGKIVKGKICKGKFVREKLLREKLLREKLESYIVTQHP